MEDSRAQYLMEVTRYNCEPNCPHIIKICKKTAVCAFYNEDLTADDGMGGWFMCGGCVDDTYGKGE